MGWRLLVPTVVHFFMFTSYVRLVFILFLLSTDVYSHFNSFLFMPPLAVFHMGFWAAHVMHNIAMGKGPFSSYVYISINAWKIFCLLCQIFFMVFFLPITSFISISTLGFG